MTYEQIKASFLEEEAISYETADWRQNVSKAFSTRGQFGNRGIQNRGRKNDRFYNLHCEEIENHWMNYWSVGFITEKTKQADNECSGDPTKLFYNCSHYHWTWRRRNAQNGCFNSFHSKISQKTAN